MIHRRAFAEHALRGHAQLRDGAAAPVHGLGISGLLREGHRLIQVCAHARVRAEVGVDHLTGLRHGDIERLRQTVCLLAVHDAEVHRLGAAAQLRGHLVNSDTEHARGGLGMEVLALVEGTHQMLVAREVRQQPQLDLRVVDGHKDRALLHRERLFDRMAQLGASGDVLQVGIGAR